MRLTHQWWSVLVAAVLGGLVGVTAVAAAGAQFLPVLSVREGAQRAVQIPRADGYIAYLTLLNARDGGINGVPLVWEECETVWDVTRTVECYERLKAKGPTGAAVFHPMGTPATYALIERATHDQIPLITLGYGRADAADGRVFPVCLQPPDQLLESEHGQNPVHRSTGRGHGPAQGPENRPCLPRLGLWPGNHPPPRPPSRPLRLYGPAPACAHRRGSTRRRPGCGSRSPSPTGSSCAPLASVPRRP